MNNFCNGHYGAEQNIFGGSFVCLGWMFVPADLQLKWYNNNFFSGKLMYFVVCSGTVIA